MKFTDLVNLLEDDSSDEIVDYNDKVDWTTGEVLWEGVRCWHLMDTGRYAVIKNITRSIYVDRNFLIHRDNGPALVDNTFTDSREVSFYKHGRLHRLDGPACVIQHFGASPSNRNYYFINGKKYSIDEYSDIMSKVDKENVEDVVSLKELF